MRNEKAAAVRQRLTVPVGQGRPARFCSPACRVAAHRRRNQGLAEAMPRWNHARGRLSLTRQSTWEAQQVAGEQDREKRRLLAAQRRALRRLGEAREAARSLGVLHGTPEPSAEAVTAWEAIHAAAVRCQSLDVRVKGRRYGWDAEVARAVRRVAALTPAALPRAERRRREREERKAVTRKR